MSSLFGKRVFITGATGFIGGHLACRLHSEGAHILALERTPGKGDALKELGIEIVQGDITDHARMSEIIGQDVHIIFHIAAWVLGATYPQAIGQIFNGLSDGPVTRADFFGGFMKMIPTERAKRIPCWVVKPIAAVLSPFFSRYNLRFLVDQNCGRGWISNQKAKDCLGWEPKVSLDDGLKRCEAWLRAEGVL